MVGKAVERVKGSPRDPFTSFSRPGSRLCEGERRTPLYPPVAGGIRERSHRPPRSKTERWRLNSWASYQLRQFIAYKAARAGVKVVVVPPAYSLQTCHRCLGLGRREGKRFHCVSPACGWEGEADFSGANVIALLGAVVSQPAPRTRGVWPGASRVSHSSRLPAPRTQGVWGEGGTEEGSWLACQLQGYSKPAPYPPQSPRIRGEGGAVGGG